MIESPATFLRDFGVDCVAGSVTAKGILDQPSELLEAGMMNSTDYRLTALTSDFGSLGYGSAIKVNGGSFTVKSVQRLDDGVFCLLMLQKV